MNPQIEVSKMNWEVDPPAFGIKRPIVHFQVPPMIRELRGHEWTPGQIRQLPITDFLPFNLQILAWVNCDFDGLGTLNRMAIVSTENGLVCAYYLDGTPNRTPKEKMRDDLVEEMYPQLILKT